MAIEPGLGHDGVSVAAGRRLPLTGRQRIWVILVILAVAVFAVALTGLIGKHHRAETSPSGKNIGSGIPYSAQADAIPAVVKSAPPRVVTPSPIRQNTFTAPKDKALESPMFSTAGASSDGTANARRGGSGDKNQADKDDEFTAAMTASSVGAAAKAHRMRHPELTIPAGIIVPCVLQTAINSELAGFVDCTLPQEVRSADGTVTLMDKGTQVMGQIKSGLRRGQNRLFILWTRARTPDNVTVDLASPAADELGRAGVGCTNGDDCVNTHFWKMFGTAALFSLIEYGPQLATAAIQNQNQSSISNYTTFLTPMQSMANTILQDDLHIPPTLEKNQGDLVSIFIARDLSFEGVYDLRASR